MNGPAGLALRATLAQVADPAQLAAAWADVLSSDREDGALGHGVARFAEDADEHLACLADELRSGKYQPGRLVPVELTRPDGRIRLLHVPAVRDRVVERSILAVLTPEIDPLLGPFSYAYRPGLGVADAAQAIAVLRDEGLAWVARTDFHDCFGSIPVPYLRRLLSVLVADADLLALVGALLDRRAAAPGSAAVVSGLPQGSPLSPLWANLVLAGFDTRVARAGFPVVRYSDDLVALAASRDDAWEAMRTMSDAAAELGMPLDADKSAVMSFAEGFCFVGEDFGPRYPPVLAGHRVDEPTRRVLYLAMQGRTPGSTPGASSSPPRRKKNSSTCPAAWSSGSCASGRSGSAPDCAPGHWHPMSTWCSCPAAAATWDTPGPRAAASGSPGCAPSCPSPAMTRG